jgi:hypothetical protein
VLHASLKPHGDHLADQSLRSAHNMPTMIALNRVVTRDTIVEIHINPDRIAYMSPAKTGEGKTRIVFGAKGDGELAITVQEDPAEIRAMIFERGR